MADGSGDHAGERDRLDAGAWSALVERTRALLREVAATGATVTYGELRRRLGVELPGEEGRDLAALLRSASVAEEEEGRGLVSAVVVRPSGLPGPGWFRLAAQMGRDVSDRERAWLEERERLHGRGDGGASSA